MRKDGEERQNGEEKENFKRDLEGIDITKQES